MTKTEIKKLARDMTKDVTPAKVNRLIKKEADTFAKNLRAAVLKNETPQRKRTVKKSVVKSRTSAQAEGKKPKALKPSPMPKSRKNRAKKVETIPKENTRKRRTAKVRPNVEGILKEYGWKLNKDKYEHFGWQVKVTRNKITVYPRGALEKTHYDMPFKTVAGYDCIAIKQGTPEEDVRYLLDFLNENDSPKQMKVKKRTKTKSLFKKFSYCQFCNLGDEGPHCSHIKESGYFGTYCSNEKFWSNYYCKNAVATAYKKHKKSFPQFRYYVCKLSKEMCPYTYPYLVPNTATIRPEEATDETSKIKLMNGLRSGYEDCKNYVAGLKYTSQKQDK